MNATQLVKAVAVETGVSEDQVSDIFNSVLKNILNGVADDGKVSISRFGTFKRVVTNERQCYNPVLKKKVNVPSRVKIRFIPSEYTMGNI